MFEQIATDSDTRKNLTFSFNKQLITAKAGDTVAAALLGADVVTFRRSLVSDSPRGPFCMMGACFECVVEINGEKAQACMTPVEEGMQIRMPESLNTCEEAPDEKI